MNNTVYEINGSTGKIQAAQDTVLGWCISFREGEWESLRYGHCFNAEQLKDLANLFVGPLYPQELKNAFELAIFEQVQKENAAVKQQRLEKMQYSTRLQMAEANAVAPVDQMVEDLREAMVLMSEDFIKERNQHQIALSRLAIEFVNRRLRNELIDDLVGGRFRLIRAYLMDNVFELSLRGMGLDGRYLSHDDCQVTVKEPSDPELVALLDGIIPFTQ